MRNTMRSAAGLTPLVGREEEIELLLRRWTQANNGEGRVVLLTGVPGETLPSVPPRGLLVPVSVPGQAYP
jgi:hypothetical protein